MIYGIGERGRDGKSVMVCERGGRERERERERESGSVKEVREGRKIE